MAWGEILSLMAFSSVKLLFAPATVLAVGYNTLETVAITTFGGIIGIVVFAFFGKLIFSWWDKVYKQFFPNKSKKKIFSRKSRLTVRIKQRYGLVGLASLMPLISIPISVIIAVKFYRHDRRFFPIYFTVLIFWVVVLTLLSEPIVMLFKNAIE